MSSTQSYVSPSVYPDLPKPVMFKKRRLFSSIGLRTATLAVLFVTAGYEVSRRAPWHSPLWCLCVAAAYLVYYLTYAAKTNVFYGKSWLTNQRIRQKTLAPLPTSSSAGMVQRRVHTSSSTDTKSAPTMASTADFIAKTLRSVPTLQGKGYKPTCYLESPAVQTMYATALRADPHVSYDRELVTHLYADGEVCILDWSFSSVANDGWRSVTSHQSDGAKNPNSNSKPAPVVVLFHGLTGGSDDCNMHYTTKILNDNGFHVVIPVRRGCADAANLISCHKHYPYGDEEDTALAVSYISKKMAGHYLLGVGLSAGSNVLAMYLGTQGPKAKFRAAISVANGYCWNDGTQCIVKGHAFWSTLMMSMVQYNLLRRHDTDVFFGVDESKRKKAAERAEQQTTAANPSVDKAHTETLGASSRRSGGRGSPRKSTGGARNSKKINGENDHAAASQGQSSLYRVVESHDLHQIRTEAMAASSPTTKTPNSNGGGKDFPATTHAQLERGSPLPPPRTPTTDHRYVDTLLQSSAAAMRLVARTVTRTQLLANTSTLHVSSDESSDDESPTTTPFPYPFDPENFLQKRPRKRRVVVEAAAAAGGENADATLKSSPTSWYHDYSTFAPETHQISSTTTTRNRFSYTSPASYDNLRAEADSSKKQQPEKAEDADSIYFDRLTRTGLRGAFNEQFTKDQERLFACASAAAAAYGASEVCRRNEPLDEVSEAAVLADHVTAPLAALQHHQREQVRLRHTRCRDPVVLKEHYAHMRDYDELVSRRIHGYHDLRSFYDAQSCRYVIKDITVPTFFLNALDDPVASAEVIPYRELSANPNTTLITTARGGHLGWADGPWPFPVSYHTWLERFILEVLLSAKAEIEAGRL